MNSVKFLVLALTLTMTTGAFAKSHKKESKAAYKAAKEACLTENPSLKKKALKSCIQAKKKESASAAVSEVPAAK